MTTRPDGQGVLRRSFDPSDDTLRVKVSDGILEIEEPISIVTDVPEQVLYGQQTVAVAGTAEALADATAVKSVVIKALADNTGDVHVGGNDQVHTDSNPGFVLAAGETVALDIDNLGDVWIDAAVPGEGVCYLAVV